MRILLYVCLLLSVFSATASEVMLDSGKVITFTYYDSYYVDTYGGQKIPFVDLRTVEVIQSVNQTFVFADTKSGGRYRLKDGNWLNKKEGNVILPIVNMKVTTYNGVSLDLNSISIRFIHFH